MLDSVSHVFPVDHVVYTPVMIAVLIRHTLIH